IVRGLGIAVTAVACTYQCAETTRIARGRGTAWPNARQAVVYRFFSSAFIGFPCPKNAAGMTVIAPPAVVPLIIAPGWLECETASSAAQPDARPAAAGPRRSARGSQRAPGPSR